MKPSTKIQTANHLKELLLLLSVPIGIILVLFAFLYVPRLFANPTYDFLYCEGYSCENNFSVNSSGRLIASPESDRYPYRNHRLYYYDSERDSSRPIQTMDASGFLLDPTSKSPDGYLLKQNSNSGGFLFWSDYSRSWSLSKGVVSQPIALNSSDIKFIGWVVENE